MREQQVLVEAAVGTADLHFERNASEFGERLPGTRLECERHQRRTRLDNAQAELARNAVAEVGGADLRD